MSSFGQEKEFWCPICPRCKTALPTNHSKCKCNKNNIPLQQGGKEE